MADSFEETEVVKERSVWEDNSGSCLMNVSGLLTAGQYEIEKDVREDGTIVLRCEPVGSED
ncbi:hypothetical protein GCM10008995_26370 [Halobellus salinus]|uniref:Uncharacterized protein n=1 Tax=Halobellus salinus TaxID=931585 RepID=A0A830EDJ7_9EURY|nr:hypothetical protein [Halobellus salinus]GGJ15286.1 hypothetical protein GCM10008995_26370 [Halobellus salinus]